MSREITDTNKKFPSQEIADGNWLFKVVSVEKKYGGKGGEYFVWKLQYEGGEGEQLLMPNMMAGLLRALKCDEIEPNKFDWDTFEQYGKFFYASVSHKPDNKDKSIIRQHMGDFKSYDEDTIPF